MSTATGLRRFVLGAFVAMCPVVALLSARGMSALLVVGALALLITGRRWPPSPGQLAILALGSLILLGAASLVWSIAPEVSRLQTLQLLGIAIPGLLVMGIMGDPLGKACHHGATAWLPAGLALASGILLIDLLANFPIYRLLNLLPGSAEVEAYVHNKAATALAVLLFPALLVLKGGAWHGIRSAAPQVALAALASAGILIAPSQSAIIALVGGLAVLLMAHLREEMVRRCLGILTIGAAVLSPAVAILLPPVDGAALRVLPYSAAQRIEIWRYIGNLVAEHPLLGIGIDGARHVLSNARGSIEGSLHPHNVFLQIWLELGAVGVAWLAGFVLFLLSRIGRMPAAARPYADAGFAAGVLVSSFAWGIWQTWWLATLLVAAALFSAEARRRDDG